MIDDPAIEALRQGLTGLTVADVTGKTLPNGDHYTVLHFSGGASYEHLDRFTANDHQVAVARETLQRIRDNSGMDGVAAAVAAEALQKMETFKK